MNRLESRLQRVDALVRPECLICPDFQEALGSLRKYDLRSPKELGESVMRFCEGRPTEIPIAHPDGTPLEYFEQYNAGLCAFGEAKQLEDAVQSLQRYNPDMTRAEALVWLS